MGYLPRFTPRVGFGRLARQLNMGLDADGFCLRCLRRSLQASNDPGCIQNGRSERRELVRLLESSALPMLRSRLGGRDTASSLRDVSRLCSNVARAVPQVRSVLRA